MTVDLATKYQRQLLNQAQQIYHHTPISDATVRAYLATPRHLFVARYLERANENWFEINKENLDQHSLVLARDDDHYLWQRGSDRATAATDAPMGRPGYANCGEFSAARVPEQSPRCDA